ncbi:MAG: hypothetical protein ABEJ79_09430 [Halolamina sp.]
MSVLDSLPDRPLHDAELAALNRAESVDLAVDVSDAAADGDGENGNGDGDGDHDDEDGVTALLLATDEWVVALACGTDPASVDGPASAAGAWREVERVGTADAERYEAMRVCEDAVRDAAN